MNVELRAFVEPFRHVSVTRNCIYIYSTIE
jgi:hypothetical protein